MDIFGKHIFGEDAQTFINLCFEDQVKWIEKYTTQRNPELIKELLDNLSIGKEECLDCREKREQYGNSISQAVPEQTSNGSQQAGVRGYNGGDNTKRPKAKRKKD